MTQLQQLATPFPEHLVKKAPQGKFGSYVAHSAITERLLSIVGPFSYEIVEVIHGHAKAVIGKNGTAEHPTYPARDQAIVGCLGRLTVTIDGRTVSVIEVGDVEEAAMNNDGRNLKDASSDAIKRCAMRLGLGLHLWSQSDYFLEAQLSTGEDGAQVSTGEVDPDAEAIEVAAGARLVEVVSNEPVEAPPKTATPAEKRMNTIKIAAWEHTTGTREERVVEATAIVEQSLAVYGRDPKNQSDVDAILANIEEMFEEKSEDEPEDDGSGYA